MVLQTGHLQVNFLAQTLLAISSKHFLEFRYKSSFKHHFIKTNTRTITITDYIIDIYLMTSLALNKRFTTRLIEDMNLGLYFIASINNFL